MPIACRPHPTLPKVGWAKSNDTCPRGCPQRLILNALCLATKSFGSTPFLPALSLETVLSSRQLLWKESDDENKKVPQADYNRICKHERGSAGGALCEELRPKKNKQTLSTCPRPFPPHTTKQ
ncbi:hypothetical protein VTH06DRAFT_8232 [Thermothelomyces fergusii]